ncbi:glycohydrolase toxin TNT-related protein [Actinomadura sp. NTSP31]|uniref:glycohydrolase toxin TNT-related protein n=1 Tax=Actinomadura sp. NTSP31 TaxID=1735447 RepID=UPI0035C04C4C
MAEPNRDRLLNDIATLIAHVMPGGWELASLTYLAVGESFEWIALGGGLVRPRRVGAHSPARAGELIATEEKLPGSGVYELLRRLRAEAYEEGRGTWMRLCLDVTPPIDGRPFLTAEHDWPDQGDWWESSVPWRDEVPARAWAEELRMFPRPDSLVPDWMRAPLALHAAAESFEPGMARGEDELTALLRPAGLEDLFPRAREVLDGLAPGASGRFLAGRLGDGCWSVVRSGPAWLAVRQEAGRLVEVAPFAEPRPAVTWAMGGVLADAGLEVDADVLRKARIIRRQTPPGGTEDVWLLDQDHRHRIRRGQPRPRAEAAGRRAYVALGEIHHRPDEHFVCRPGPPPERGDFMSTQEIFSRLAGTSGLPLPPPPPQEPAEDPYGPTVTLPAGTELDAYGDPERPFLFTIGTPFEVRGLTGSAAGLPYHVYRLVEPLDVAPGLFTDVRAYPAGAPPEDLPPRQGRGFYTYETVAALLRSGRLIEIGGPGGEPIPPAGQ